MVVREDIERLVEAHRQVQELLVPEPRRGIDKLKARLMRSPTRRAARILCEELTWLVHERADFWVELAGASATLAGHRGREAALLETLEDLLLQEGELFRRLGIDDRTTSGVIATTYEAFRIIGDYGANPSPAAVANLRDRLARATELVCAASRGPLTKTYEFIISTKGVRILGGAAVAGTNALFATADGGALSWTSVKAGFIVMTADAGGLIELLEKRFGG